MPFEGSKRTLDVVITHNPQAVSLPVVGAAVGAVEVALLVGAGVAVLDPHGRPALGPRAPRSRGVKPGCGRRRGPARRRVRA